MGAGLLFGFAILQANTRASLPEWEPAPQHLRRARAVRTETRRVPSVPARQAPRITARAHPKFDATERPCRRGPLFHTLTEKPARHPTATFFFLTSVPLVSNPIFRT